MTDRFFDIFVGFYKPNGELEHRLIYVVFNNLGIKFFLEIGHSMVPWFIHYKKQKMRAHWYAVIKLARYSRLFEMDTHINNFIESQADRKTVFELAQMDKIFDILKFILSTCCNLHIMSCT